MKKAQKKVESTSPALDATRCYKMPLFPLEKYGFVLVESDNEYYKYKFEINDNYFKSIYIEAIVFNGNMYCLSYYQDGKEKKVANRYICNTEKELEFILFNGRVGVFLKPINDISDVE